MLAQLAPQMRRCPLHRQRPLPAPTSSCRSSMPGSARPSLQCRHRPSESPRLAAAAALTPRSWSSWQRGLSFCRSVGGLLQQQRKSDFSNWKRGEAGVGSTDVVNQLGRRRRRPAAPACCRAAVAVYKEAEAQQGRGLGGEGGSDSSKAQVARVGSESVSSAPENALVSCTTFNVLAPIYKRLDSDNERESNYHEAWLARNEEIIRQLLAKQSSVICLQELWLANPELVRLYETRLGAEGYTLFNLPRTNDRGDGLMTAVRTDRFEVLDHHAVPFYDCGDRVAQIVRLRSRPRSVQSHLEQQRQTQRWARHHSGSHKNSPDRAGEEVAETNGRLVADRLGAPEAGAAAAPMANGAAAASTVNGAAAAAAEPAAAHIASGAATQLRQESVRRISSSFVSDSTHDHCDAAMQPAALEIGEVEEEDFEAWRVSGPCSGWHANMRRREGIGDDWQASCVEGEEEEGDEMSEKGLELLVVNTHLLFPHDENSSFIRLGQVYKLLEHLEAYKARHDLKPLPIILCGDLNGTKQGQVYKFLRSQGFASSYDLAHDFSDDDEPWVSHRNHHGVVCGVDFIWLLNPSEQRRPLTADWKAAIFQLIESKLSTKGYEDPKEAFEFFCYASDAEEDKAVNDGDDDSENDEDVAASGRILSAAALAASGDDDEGCELARLGEDQCYITVDGFHSAIGQLGLTGEDSIGLTREEVEMLMRSVDSDGNGIVDFEEFKNLLLKQLSKRDMNIASLFSPPEQPPPTPRAAAAAAASEVDATDVHHPGGHMQWQQQQRQHQQQQQQQQQQQHRPQQLPWQQQAVETVPVEERTCEPSDLQVTAASLYPPEMGEGVWPSDYSLSDHALLTAVFSPVGNACRVQEVASFREKGAESKESQLVSC